MKTRDSSWRPQLVFVTERQRRDENRSTHAEVEKLIQFLCPRPEGNFDVQSVNDPTVGRNLQKIFIKMGNPENAIKMDPKDHSFFRFGLECTLPVHGLLHYGY